MTTRPRVAVIGAGVAGLGAAFALDAHADVTVFEAGPRAGGHVYTVDVATPHGPRAVDMGFIVCNRAAYPRLFGIFDALGIATQPSEMAFSVSLPNHDLEWGSAHPRAWFADRRNLLRPRHWHLLWEVRRFLTLAAQAHADPHALPASLNLDEFLAQHRFSARLRDQFIVPLAAALWSLDPARCGEFPARTYVGFLANHQMLDPLRAPNWQTVVGGSRRYVDAIVARLRGPVHLATPVAAIARDATSVTVTTARGPERFDYALVATHADVALRMLAAPTPVERAVLGAFSYSDNRTVLHRDTRLLPRHADARASWNYRATDDGRGVEVTYWMNRLQALPMHTLHMVTLNPRSDIAPNLIDHEVWFRHPVFDRKALTAQGQLPSLQGQARTYFAGAYARYGFHEDGLRAGQEAAAQLLADAQGSGARPA